MKIKVTQDLDYVQGHLRYGHREGIIEADSLEDAKQEIEKEEDYEDFLSIVVDDYEIDDWDEGNNEFKYEEIEEINEIKDI